MTLDYGWIYINYGQGAGNGEMRLATMEPPSIDIDEKDLNIFDMPGDRRTRVDGIETVIRMVTLKDVLFKSEADSVLCQKNLRKLNRSGPMTMRWAKSDTPTFSNFWTDGTTDYNEMIVKYKTYKGGKKVSKGNQDIWKVDMIQFRQAG